jgi:hypothetical protein
MPFKKRFREIISTLGQKKTTLNATYGEKTGKNRNLFTAGFFQSTSP